MSPTTESRPGEPAPGPRPWHRHPATVCLFLFLSVAAACQGDRPKRKAKPPQTSHAKAPAPLLKRRRQIMSTWFELSVPGAQGGQAAATLEAALDEIARLEDLLSEWRPHTEISRLNRRAGDGTWVPLGPESVHVLRTGLEVSRWSQGAYDLTWAALRGLYKFDGEKRVPSDEEIAPRLQRVGYGGLELTTTPPQARLARAGMAAGTGGIAKGYALDRAGALLQAAGLEDYLLFAGGQVQVSGSRGGRPWRVGIQHPREPSRYIGFLEVNSGSLSTSGDYEHAFVANGKLWHHILDLRTGRPARRSVSVTLLAPKGVYADALSTACFVLGPSPCLRMLSELPFEAHAVIIDPELKVHVSPGLSGKVRFSTPLRDGKLPPPP